jgi:integrase
VEAAKVPTRPWDQLVGKIASEILVAPKTGGDPHYQGNWPEVPRKVTSYLERNVIAKPWADTIALLASIMIARRFEVTSVLSKIVTLHSRFTSLFPFLGLERMESWDPARHFPLYLKADVLPDDPQTVRQRFWVTYNSASKLMGQWLGSLPEPQRQIYQKFTLPPVSRLFVEGLIRQKEVTQQQQRTRKAETDAVVPRFAAIRAEAHLRYNRIARLRRAYHQALHTWRGKGPDFPATFSYEEGGDKELGIPTHERLWFRIWDRRSFVLAHEDAYSPGPLVASRCGTAAFANESNYLFLEFVRAERLIGDAPPEGFWFEELFKLGMFGLNPSVGSAEEVKAKQAWLSSWGYGGTPFFADVGGLLTWPVTEGRFMASAQRRTTGVLVPVEAIYAAATIGLMAADLFTTTGARINEVMQIRLTADCIVRLKMPPPPGSKDPSPRIRYVLRLVPKGEKTNTPQDYFIGAETKRLLVRVAQMLGEHYQLQPGEVLPSVEFSASNGRADRFAKGPYLFQYAGRHLSANTIASCMRFLLHGMVFRTREGKLVVLKPHLLRHAFATHAVQIEKIPIDVVGAWLHQKNLTVTDYYSKPTESMVAEASDLFLSRVAAQINVSEAVLRSPDELQQLYEEARGKAGTLADVIGGQCVSHGYCAAKFACVGCAGKVPDPAKRYQIEKHKHWASLQVNYATLEGLRPEAERMRQLVRDCDNELAEMNLIESYQRDERREVSIRIEPEG